MEIYTAKLIEPEDDEDQEYGDPDELPCTWCGGECIEENPDPLWYDGDYIQCTACGGTGLRKHQTVF
jgi:hypothetical protein